MNARYYLALVVLGCMLVFSGGAFAATGTPSLKDPRAVVQHFYDALLDTMKEGPALGIEGRYNKLEPVITQSFDMELMTRFAVGNAWRTSTDEEKKSLLDAFTRFSVATYASRFRKFDGERFEIIGIQATLSDSVMIETRIIPKGSDPVRLNYRVRQDKDGNYRIVDVYLNASVSELATRRADFSAVIRRDGLAGLMRSLEDRAKAMMSRDNG